MKEITRIQHRGTEIVKVENDLPLSFDHEDFQDDFLYVSRGFIHAVNVKDLTPTTEHTEEWHHYFIKCDDGYFESRKINFK